MHGLEKGVVRLEPYSSEWKQFFEVEKAALLAVLDANILDIQHVGSTSIPGMLAKPIVDIAIAVADFEAARVCIPPIEKLGYEYKGEYGIPRRHYFVKGEPRTAHIHVTEIHSTEWQNLLLFRDYLRQHDQIAKDYAKLKRQLALQFPRDREAYLNGKAAFIEGVIQRARDQG